MSDDVTPQIGSVCYEVATYTVTVTKCLTCNFIIQSHVEVHPVNVIADQLSVVVEQPGAPAGNKV